MANGVTFKVSFNKLRAVIDNRIGTLAHADRAGAALYAEGEIEMTEAKRRTPVKWGTLRGSGHVTPPKRITRGWEVRLVFGGPAAPYAAFVHENFNAFHEVGQAKYLESTVTESTPYMGARIAKRMEQS